MISGRGSGFPFREWARINPPTFRYGSGGLEAIRAGLTMGDGDESCRAKGFSRPYGMSDLNEDVACIGEMLFSGDPTFWSSVDRYTGLGAKVDMLSRYLSGLDPELNLDLFRLLPASPFVARSNRFEPGELVYFADGGKVVSPSDPLRVITVQPGGAAVFPVRSGVHLNTRSTTLDPDLPHPVPRLPMPDPLQKGYLVATGERFAGGWLIYAEGPRPGKVWRSGSPGPTGRAIRSTFPLVGVSGRATSRRSRKAVAPGRSGIYPQKLSSGY